MKIQSAMRAHLERLCEIEADVFPMDRFRKRQFSYLMTKAHAIFKVGILDGNVVGYYILLMRKGCCFTRLYSLAVDRSYAGRSLGSLLLQDAEKETKNVGLEDIHLEVRVDNHRARQLYFNRGFTEIREIEDYYEDGQSAAVMGKKLTAGS